MLGMMIGGSMRVLRLGRDYLEREAEQRSEEEAHMVR
jgi:hypothetical protein